jgi:hypothetical protein
MMIVAHSLARLRRWLPLVLILGAAGCATPQIDWNSRIGVYTHDQAVLELGPPDRQARLEDGTLVAEWLTRRGHTLVYSPYGYGYCYGYPYGLYGPLYPPYLQSYSYPDHYLRLVFGPDGRLKGWKKFTR